jgi:hypothetical protein
LPNNASRDPHFNANISSCTACFFLDLFSVFHFDWEQSVKKIFPEPRGLEVRVKNWPPDTVMNIRMQTKTGLLLAVVTLAAVLGMPLRTSGQDQIVMNGNVSLNGIPGVQLMVSQGGAVGGQFDCTLSSPTDTTNCHKLVVGFRDGNHQWFGGEPVVCLQTDAPPNGLPLSGVAFANIATPLQPGMTCYLWVDDVPFSICVSDVDAINSFKTNNPAGENALQKQFATVATAQVLTTPTPIAPACGGTVGTTTPWLSWSYVPAAGDYVVVISTGEDCSGTVVDSAFTGGARKYQIPVSAGLLDGQKYSWRVQARAASGSGFQDSPISSCCSFSVILPRLGVAQSGTNLVISWPTNDASDFVLTSTNTLGPGNWPNVATERVLSNGYYQVTIPPSNKAGFYRLQK